MPLRQPLIQDLAQPGQVLARRPTVPAVPAAAARRQELIAACGVHTNGAIPVPGSVHPQFRYKNRCDIGKSQSIWTDSKMERLGTQLHGGAPNGRSLGLGLGLGLGLSTGMATAELQRFRGVLRRCSQRMLS
jgi:hypothetical protein